MECFEGWGKGEPGEAWGGGDSRGGPARVAGASTGGGGMGREGLGKGGQHGPGGGTSGEGPGRGKLDRCIMHQVHTSILKLQCLSVCLSVFYLSFTYFFFSDVISLSLPLWRNPIGSRSLWSVLGGGGRESPMKHGARGANRGGANTGGEGQ